MRPVLHWCFCATIFIYEQIPVASTSVLTLVYLHAFLRSYLYYHRYCTRSLYWSCTWHFGRTTPVRVSTRLIIQYGTEAGQLFAHPTSGDGGAFKTTTTRWWKTRQNRPISHQAVRFLTNSKTCQMTVFTFSNVMIWQDMLTSDFIQTFWRDFHQLKKKAFGKKWRPKAILNGVVP